MSKVQLSGTAILLVGLTAAVLYSQEPPKVTEVLVPLAGELLQLPPPPGARPKTNADLEKAALLMKKETLLAHKEALRLANLLLQEQIEDEKVKLEALRQKLARLKQSGFVTRHESDEELAKLRLENRRLQQNHRSVQEDVREVQEEVQPIMQALEQKVRQSGLNSSAEKDAVR